MNFKHCNEFIFKSLGASREQKIIFFFPKSRGGKDPGSSAGKTVCFKGRVNLFPHIQPWTTPKSSSRHEMGRHFTWCCSNPTFKLPFRGISRQTSRPSTGRSKRSGITVARPFHLDGHHQCWGPVAPTGEMLWELHINEAPRVPGAHRRWTRPASHRRETHCDHPDKEHGCRPTARPWFHSSYPVFTCRAIAPRADTRLWGRWQLSDTLFSISAKRTDHLTYLFQ